MQQDHLSRSLVLPENEFVRTKELKQTGQKLAETITVGHSKFLTLENELCELDYKNRQSANKKIMQHAQIGFRSLNRTCEAATSIYEAVQKGGFRVDRFGICLDWSMGYPKELRQGKPRGTGLILDADEDFKKIANAAPVASHFGDFVIGMPAAVENTKAALQAGSTSIGNLGQYFTFELPGWTDDVQTTEASIIAISLAAAQKVPILIHSNIDDGFASRFTDLASALGSVLLEQYIVDELLGGKVSHCYGHTFSQSLSRFAFQRALQSVTSTPGTMIYGNTTAFSENDAANYAVLAAYLQVDIQAQMFKPSGHAINPVPITEAKRIPTAEEIIDAQIFCGKLIEKSTNNCVMINTQPADDLSNRLVEGAKRFKNDVLVGLSDMGIDITDALELMLSLRRIGAKTLEQKFGPGELDTKAPNWHKPIEPSPVLKEISDLAKKAAEKVSLEELKTFSASNLKIVTATTDVHEYGKRLLEEILDSIDLEIIDGGVSTDAKKLAEDARHADAIFLSTYNGIALDFLENLNQELDKQECKVPIFIGGKLNQVLLSTNSDLPVDITNELADKGAIVCLNVEDFYAPLAKIAREKCQKKNSTSPSV